MGLQWKEQVGQPKKYEATCLICRKKFMTTTQLFVEATYGKLCSALCREQYDKLRLYRR